MVKIPPCLQLETCFCSAPERQKDWLRLHHLRAGLLDQDRLSNLLLLYCCLFSSLDLQRVSHPPLLRALLQGIFQIMAKSFLLLVLE